MRVWIFFNLNDKNNPSITRVVPGDFPEQIRFSAEDGRDESVRRRKILSRLLLQKAFSKLEPKRENVLRDIVWTSTKKPVFKSLPYYFSSAQSEELCVLGVCRERNESIGIDAELIKPLQIGLIQEWLHPKERQKIQDSPDPLKAFYEAWTQKEAILKARGTGIGEHLNNIDTTTRPVLFENDYFFCFEVPLCPGYAINLATLQPEVELITEEIIFD